MSTHGRNAIGRGILGSVTDKVLHIGHLPVLTITPEKAKKYDGDGEITKVLVPLDGSENAEVVLPYIEDMAKKMSLEVTIVRVLKLGGALDAYSDGYSYFGVPDLETELESEAAAYVKEVADKLKAKGLKVSWKVMKGAPAICITLSVTLPRMPLPMAFLPCVDIAIRSQPSLFATSAIVSAALPNATMLVASTPSSANLLTTFSRLAFMVASTLSNI